MSSRIVNSTVQSDPQSPKGGVRNPVPDWTPRFWHSMPLADLYHLLADGKFRISRSRWLMVLLLLPVAAGNSLLAMAQKILCGRTIAKTPLTQPPLFIIGHFRSGTTYLYELLACDPTFGFPTMYECFAPNHFLLTSRWLPRLLKILLPAKRPMDNMALGFDRPQEDEFALIGLGAPTLYRRMAFPNQPAPDLVQPTTSTRRGNKLRTALDNFYRALTVKKKKRLLLKSPLHTGRVAELLDMYPGAQFIHIVRNPEKMLPSLKHTWTLLDQSQAFQEPSPDLDYEELIYNTFDALYVPFRRDTPHLAPKTLCEIRYEDLLQNPVAALRNIYQQLGLKTFEQTQPAIETYLQSLADYQSNQFDLDPQTSKELSLRWRWYYEKYGYPLP